MNTSITERMCFVRVHHPEAEQDYPVDITLRILGQDRWTWKFDIWGRSYTCFSDCPTWEDSQTQALGVLKALGFTLENT